MTLNYYLDLKSLCNANEKQIGIFFQFAFDVLTESKDLSNNLLKESFCKNEKDLCLSHKSGRSLSDVIFSTHSGEIGNRIIPIVFHNFKSKISEKIPYGEEKGKIHPNAKLVTPQKTKYLWLLSELQHYHEFRNHHIYSGVLSNNCDACLMAYLPNVSFTKDALSAYKKLNHNDKKKFINDLKKLDEYTSEKWENATFPIEDFSKFSGVDASDESETTKTNPKLKEQRLFSIPNLGSIYCFLHIKISNTYRVHFYADSKTKKIHIAYIGKHLKTAKNR